MPLSSCVGQCDLGVPLRCVGVLLPHHCWDVAALGRPGRAEIEVKGKVSLVSHASFSPPPLPFVHHHESVCCLGSEMYLRWAKTEPHPDFCLFIYLKWGAVILVLKESHDARAAL